MGISQFEETGPFNSAHKFVAATALADLYLPSFGWVNQRYDVLWATNTDVIDHVIDLTFSDGAGRHLAGSCNVPAGAGVAGVTGVNVLEGIFGVGYPGLPVNGDDDWRLNLEVAVTAAFVVTVIQMGGLV